MPVVDLSKKVGTKPDRESEVSALRREVEYSKKCQAITNKIHAAKNIDEILIDIKNDMLDFFGADRLTIYVVDGAKRELFSRVMSGDEVSEIRVPISGSSISGYAAAYNKVVNIKSAYDKKELSAVDPNMKFDSTWDQKTGYRTKQVLAVPIVHNQYILGAIQAINKKDKSDIPFSQKDAESLLDMGRTLGIAIFNQKRMARARPNKFDYLLENHLLTQKELPKAVADARKLKCDIETILMKNYKISKSDIGKSLSHFYKVPFEEYNDRVPIPGELLTNMKVNFLRNNHWVPLRKEKDAIIIAIDNPYHLQKIDTIKSLFSTGQRLAFHVALKEDIEKYIKLFFSTG